MANLSFIKSHHNLYCSTGYLVACALIVPLARLINYACFLAVNSDVKHSSCQIVLVGSIGSDCRIVKCRDTSSEIEFELHYSRVNL